MKPPLEQTVSRIILLSTILANGRSIGPTERRIEEFFQLERFRGVFFRDATKENFQAPRRSYNPQAQTLVALCQAPFELRS